MFNTALKLLFTNEEIKGPEERTMGGLFSGIVGIIGNIILFVLKLVSGIVSGSVSITADAVNNLSDASSSIISLLGFKMASKPADMEHPYGHGRYEYLSGFIVSVLIMVIGIELFKSSFERILHPAEVEFSFIFIFILLFSILVKIGMLFMNHRMGVRIHSQTLIATAADSRNDVITTTGVLAAALISHFTGVELDGWMGIAVAVFILFSGFDLISQTLNPILGAAPDEETVREIQSRIMKYDKVLGTHDLMVHDYGPGRQFASVHVEMSAEDDVIESHDILDQIERDFYENDGLHMVVHYDPISMNNDTVNVIRLWLSEEIKKIHPELTIHDFRMVFGTTHTNLIFDCVRPQGLDKSDQEIKALISTLVSQKNPEYRCVITLDQSYAPYFE